MSGNQNNHNPNQWNNQWNTGPQQSQQPSQAFPNQQPQATSTATPPSAEPKKKSPALKIGALLAALLLAIAGGSFVVTQTGIGKKLAEMTYIASADPGPEAFMNTVVEEDAAELIQASDLGSGSLAGGVEGGTDNVYGGTGDLSTCDAAALLDHLGDNSELNAAFAQGIGINAGDVERYVRALSPLVLMQDTWVTNHGFQDGHANPFQAVLQRGTAVLVDANGVPRVRCACGNPLAEAWNGYTAPSADNASWDGYEAGSVVAVFDAGETYRQLKIRDLAADEAMEFTFTDDQTNTQAEVYDAVTSDTPKTVPSDMDVKPDEELLNSLGMSVADNGDERPTGGERFQTNSGTFAAGDSSETVNFTEVDPAQFVANPHLPNGKRAFKIGDKSKDYGDAYCWFYAEISGLSCVLSEPYEDFIHLYTAGPDGEQIPGSGYRSFGHGEKSLHYTASGVMESGLGADPASLKYLEPGQEISVNGDTCQATEQALTCSNETSSLKIDFNDGVFINDSDTAFGTRCDDALRTLNGGISCDEAQRVYELYTAEDREGTTARPQPIEDFKCYVNSREAQEAAGYKGICEQQEAPYRSFAFGTA